MQIKPNTPTKSESQTESIYTLTTVAGREYTISEKDYEGIKQRWQERDFSDSILTDDGDVEAVLPFRNIDSICKKKQITS